MKALIFAAGFGERMRPLTDHTPKPLLHAGGKMLIEWHLEKLAALGISDVVVNTSWLAEQFPLQLGDGSRWGLRLHFIHEGARPLETGGGMWNARHLLGDAPFFVVNGDVWSDFDFALLPREPAGDAHLVLVDNPPQHPRGDFALADDGHVRMAGDEKLTYSGIGVYRPGFLDGWRDCVGDADGADETPPRFRLLPLMKAAIARDAMTATHHHGRWTDVGTPERLAALDEELNSAP
ncbi:N-acetylmuramate alpha-1-phosphate uridylyltransferase MurU [Solilutibacter silvestris]|uniref:Nucleotidyl transferase n=1 Tax=Solilutibacter silvestris TaxID=1645665 RepID=A0A2K1Q2W1_9GAMM|nr:nucleotidyltransferase family protein [Lysobacter silvestris]PNS09388.1 Nucleotidyl transferase [Lysobacter silvestris]